MTTLEGLEARFAALDTKLSVLVHNGKPANINEYISMQTITILTIIGILTAIWCAVLIKKLELDTRRYWLSAIITLVGAIIIYYCAKALNNDRARKLSKCNNIP